MIERGRLSLHVILLLGLLLIGFEWITRELARPWIVGGRSMEPTLLAGDRVVVDLWTYRQRPPAVGELVLFRGPGVEATPLIKRVAAARDGRRPRANLWPGSEALDRPGIWVLGDNPAVSRDSRAFGSVPQDRLVGRVVLRYWRRSAGER